MTEAAAIRAGVIRRARVAPLDARQVEPLLRVTLRPRGGMRLGVSAR